MNCIVIKKNNMVSDRKLYQLKKIIAKNFYYKSNIKIFVSLILKYIYDHICLIIKYQIV